MLKPSTKRHAAAVALVIMVLVFILGAASAPLWAYATIAALFGYPTSIGVSVGAGVLPAFGALIATAASSFFAATLYRFALDELDERKAKKAEAVEPPALPAALDMLAVHRNGAVTYVHAPDFDLRDEVIAEASREIATLRAQLEGSMAETRAVCAREVELAQQLARLQPTG